MRAMSDATGTRILRWGILGAGNIATKFAALFATCRNARAVAIASRSPQRAGALARRFNIARAYDDYQKLLADPDIEIVYNALHTGLHCEWTVRALESGKHVLCEKPLARNAEEVEKMMAASQRTGKFLMEGFMYRFHPQMEILQRLLSENAIGKVKLVKATYTNPRRVTDTPLWKKEWGGGASMDLGCYAVDICRLVANSEPVESIARLVYPPDATADETLVGILRFPENRIGLIHASFNLARTHRCEIFGEHGILELPNPWRSEEVPLTVLLHRDGQVEQFVSASASPFRLELEFFSDCVAQNRTPVFPFRPISAVEDSLATMRVLDALRSCAS
jgi:predicted dehydrogenase